MITDKYIIWKEEEYHYPGAVGFVPNIYTYLHDDEQLRPCILVVPGGAYRFVSATEGEIVAKKFYHAGFQAFVLTYTTNQVDLCPLKEQPLMDLSRAVRFIRKHADAFKIQTEKVFVCGFSAGAHLAGSLAVHWKDARDSREGYREIENKPTGVILSYPVITSGEYAHRESILALCGADACEAELQYHSLETQVKKDMPPIFMWQTVTDGAVPVENSMLMASALRKAGVPFEYHLFPEGVHGLSLSDVAWESGDLGEFYTLDQTRRLLLAIKNGEITPDAAKGEQLLGEFAYLDPDQPDKKMPRPAPRTAVPAVSVWTDLAVAWMNTL